MAISQGGAGNYRQYADRASFDVNNITIASWIYPAETTASATAISRGTAATNGDWLLGVGATAARWRFLFRKTGTNYAATDSADFSTTVWYLVVGVYNGANALLYVYESTTGTARTITGDATTGNLNNSTAAIRFYMRTSGANEMNCRIAGPTMWDTALSANEIAAMQRGVQPLTIRNSNIILHDPFWGTGSFDVVGKVAPTDNGAIITSAHSPMRPWTFGRRLASPDYTESSPPAVTNKRLLLLGVG